MRYEHGSDEKNIEEAILSAAGSHSADLIVRSTKQMKYIKS